MKNYRLYLGIAASALIGGIIAAVAPGLDVAVGICCGAAAGLALASGARRRDGRRC